jgi:hypothetical protein
MTTKTLAEFLIELDSNAKLKDDYLKDPVTTASDYGLAPEDISIIKEQDWDRVRQQFEELGKAIKIHSY